MSITSRLYPTPLQVLPRASQRMGIDLRMKRDDLLPSPGGGNKVRKLARILAEPGAQPATALVTNGGLQSNHARVAALCAAERGWACELVLHGDSEELRHPSGNLLLMRLCGARLTVVEPDGVRDALADAVVRLEGEGHTPLLVPGGGHSLAGAMAYAEAIDELARQSAGWIPDWIIVASGTGATQAGLIAGVEAAGWATRVTGISVARSLPRGREAVEEILTPLREHLPAHSGRADVDFRDQWTAGGYERVDAALLSFIEGAMRLDGIVLDPTYTGKAYLGLQQMVDAGEVIAGSRVLFWHTGGLMNLLSSTHFRAPGSAR